MVTEQGKPYEFDFAISFSGEHRSVAKQLAEQLTARGAAVFYDDSYRARLLGKRLDHEFRWVFGAGSRFFVPIVSSSYADRAWPQHEWNVARRESQKRQEEFILPLRVDDSVLFGLPDTVCYLDLRRHTIQEVAEVLIEKIGGAEAAVTRHRGGQTWVAAFGLLIEDLVESGSLPPDAPPDYPRLCDWLTKDLMRRFARVPVEHPRFTEDARSGETLSVRVAFEWDISEGPLEFSRLGWWELLELLPYDEVYGPSRNAEGG